MNGRKMEKHEGSLDSIKRNPKESLKDKSKNVPEIQEYEVYEAQTDRIRDISPKNDKAK